MRPPPARDSTPIAGNAAVSSPLSPAERANSFPRYVGIQLFMNR
jgi:hypothetical protein